MIARSRFCRLLAICCFLLGTAGEKASAGQESEQVSGAKAKAAFLYTIVKFVQWPPSDLPSDSFVIGLVAQDSFRRTLEGVVNGRLVNGRSIAVRELKDDDEARGCHIVFIEDAGDDPRKAGVLRRAREGGVLTVGETDRFLLDGGLVRLYIEADRLRFKIDFAGVQQAGLKMSAQLMSLAK